MQMAGAEARIVPEKMEGYVKWGHHKTVATILASGEFYPGYVTGLSGNGKTTMIMQAAADANREIYRVNITAQTDEDDLIGGFRLLNGDTVWVDGPAVVAAKKGAILLLDEIDLGGPALMCLQPLLEGNGSSSRRLASTLSRRRVSTFSPPPTRRARVTRPEPSPIRAS